MPVKWLKQLIAREAYESAGVADVNGDGVPDILSGAWWYEGPDFTVRHHIADVMPEGEYFDDFSTIIMDVNGDGRPDFVTGGWFGKNLRWHENPGSPDKDWPAHIIATPGNVETTRAWDIDRDGTPEIVPNCPGGALVAYKLDTDASGKGLGTFTAHTLYEEPQGHGLGFGDISGSGRGDFVLRNGWLEAPENPYTGKWTFHPDFDLGVASIPIIVADVNGDGLSDLIVGSAHNYGLDWWEQGRDASGSRTWTCHPIDPFNAQYHDLLWLDIDGDGAPELVTGKRHRAHCGNDPGEFDDIGLYYFKWTGENFAKQVIDYGPPETASGAGIHLAAADLRGTGRLDLIAPGKEGLFVFFNE